jgi:serine protease Do
MEAAVRMHKDYQKFKPSLAGKQVEQDRYKTPRDYPSLSGKYGEAIDYEGKTAKSCMHCHQVREAERLVYRAAKEPIPDEVLFPYPDPAVLGLKMDPKGMATVERVATDSIAGRAELKAGDEITTLAGQPLLSIADLQWVLHNAPASAKLTAQVRRDGKPVGVTLDLREGWRRGDISWRTTTWDLRRMGLGGLWLEELKGEQRSEAKLAEDSLALRVRHLGEYGEHAVAKRAGFQKGDIVVSFDGLAGKMSESDLLAYTMQRKRPGDEVAVTVLRNGRRETLKFALQ